MENNVATCSYLNQRERWWLPSEVLFYPSAIIAAGALLLWGMIDEDELPLDTITMPAGRTR